MGIKVTDEWWTAPTESESGRLVMVTGHDDLDSVRLSGKYNSRVDVKWRYNALPDGMPEPEDAALMEQAHEALLKELKKDTAAVMTGVYTGDGERDWVFYTRSLAIFGRIFNRALKDLPTLPLVIEAQDDPDWEEYLEMRDISYINPGE